MKLRAADLRGARLDLDFSTPEGGARRIGLADITELGGGLSIGDRSIDLEQTAVSTLTVAELAWTAGSVELALETPAVATEVAVNMRIAKAAARATGAPFAHGTATLGRLRVARMGVTIGQRRTAFGLELEEVAVSVDADGVHRADIGRALLTEIQTRPGNFMLRAPSLELRDVSVTAGADDLRVVIGHADIPGLHLSGSGLDVEAGPISLPGGATVSRDRVDVPVINAGAASVTLAQLLSARGETPAERTERRPLPIDLELLDLLAGRIDVDLDVDVSLPVIGRRKATHHFRLGVESGTIDFKQLESGLAGLEDAFIDFELDGDTLVLERDIPLIPGDNKPILTWKLPDAAEVALAGRNRVRLRRLAAFEVAGAAKAKPENKNKSSVALNKLVLDDIDVALSMSPASAAVALDGAGQNLEGWIRRASLGKLEAKGAIHHVPGAEPTPSQLRLTGSALEVCVAGVPVGSRHAGADLAIAALETLEVGFSGLRPASLSATMAGIAFERVALALR